MHDKLPQSLCRAGASRGDITPPVGMYHRMWGAATHDRSTGVHRPLLASVLAVRPLTDDPGAGLVLVALDHCILGDADLANIRQRVASKTTFPAERVHVTLSHTHGAGLMMRDRAELAGGDLIAPYLDQLAERVGELAREAEERLRPVVITYATGSCDLAADRDFYDEQSKSYVCGFNPHKPADDTLLVARIDDRDARQTIAAAVNYACHPTTLAWQNTLISPDFVGAMRETVETRTKAAPCLFLQGASGELGPREQYVGDVAVADRHGRRLGYAALAALASLPDDATKSRFVYAGPVMSGTSLGTWAYERADTSPAWRYRSWDVRLPYRTDLPTLAQTRADRERLILQENATTDPIAARDLHARVEQLTRQIMRLEALPQGDEFPLRVTVWQAGDAVWVFVAGEHYSALQTNLRARFPGTPILVTTITDGWQPGYLPTAQTYGKGIYQETIAMLAAGALERVTEEIARLIAQWVGEAPEPS